jgi:hypothetical protein
MSMAQLRKPAETILERFTNDMRSNGETSADREARFANYARWLLDREQRDGRLKPEQEPREQSIM